jgi:hypothetical protein
VTRDEILAAVLAERERQEILWGEQNHPDVPMVLPATKRGLHRADAEKWKILNARRVNMGHLAWDGILLEEVYEALAEADPDKLRTELVQSMAVILNWLECIGRRMSTQSAMSPEASSEAST